MLAWSTNKHLADGRHNNNIIYKIKMLDINILRNTEISELEKEIIEEFELCSNLKIENIFSDSQAYFSLVQFGKR